MTLSTYRKENNIHDNMAKLNKIDILISRVKVTLHEMGLKIRKRQMVLREADALMCFSNSLETL